MKDSLERSQSSLKGVKPDPFALADLDKLADEIGDAVAAPDIDRERVQSLVGQMKRAAEQVTLFFIESAENVV